MIWLKLSQYICLSLIVGYFILRSTPKTAKPTLHLSKYIVFIATSCIMLIMLLQSIPILLFLMQKHTLATSMATYFLTYEKGKVTLWVIIVTIILMGYIKRASETKAARIVGLVLSLLLIIGLAWGSHINATQPYTGALIQTMHIFAVSMWVGVLLWLSVLAKDTKHWLSFLQWFSKLAMICLVGMAITGVLALWLIIPSYPASWYTSYGHALLWKNILMLPVLYYALMNGVLIKKRILQQPSFNPLPWLRVETIVLLLIFTITAYLSNQEPPQNVIVTNEAIPILIQQWLDLNITTTSTISLTVSYTAILGIVVTGMIMVCMIYSFVKEYTVWLTIVLTVMVSSIMYIAILSSIQIS